MNQQRLLEEGHRLDELHRSYDGDAALNESFVVLTFGASLIASLGLLANNAAVVIGAMVVAPWILPLRTAVFATMIGDWKLLPRAALTLLIGAVITTALSIGLGLVAHANGLLIPDSFPEEIQSRLKPTVLDLGIALAAGSIATYAKVVPGAVSSMAGTAIAVALVPPVCAMGLTLATGHYEDARGAGLLYAANLLGILIGGIATLAIREPYFRKKLRVQRRSRLPFVLALALASWVGVQLYGRYEHHLFELRRESAKARIEREVIATLKQKTETFGSNPFLEMQSIEFDWPDFWDNDQSPKVLIVARVVDPAVPSYKQVQMIQDLINNNISADYKGLKLQVRVQRINVTEVSGEEMPSTRSVDDILIEPVQPINFPDLQELPELPKLEELEDPPLDPNLDANENELTNENGMDLKPEPPAKASP